MMAKKLATTSSSQWVSQWEVASESNPSKFYKVSQRQDGSFACDCPAWKFKPAPKPPCKHINGLIAKEPVDKTRTTPKAEQEFVRAGRTKQVTTSEPVFLLQTIRRLILPD
jgi:hypothetical protein